MKIGSSEHRDTFCKHFMQTYTEFDPGTLPLTDFLYYMRALGRMIGTAKRGKDLNDGKEFSATQASVFLDGCTFRRFLEGCHSENRHRMGAFVPELLRPSFLPQLAETALGAMRLLSFRAKPLPA